MKQKTALVFGAGGMIGHAVVKYLIQNNYWVRAADLKNPEYSHSPADEFLIGDLRSPSFAMKCMLNSDYSNFRVNDKESGFDILFNFAAKMGGAQFIFTGENDAEIMHDSAMINLNTAYYASLLNVKKVFFSSSACVYPQDIQTTATGSALAEHTAWPLNPDSPYGIEKGFSEKVYDAFARNKKLDIRIGRLHNIFSEECAFNNGLEKAPAAICYKIAKAKTGDTIEIIGDGEQVRSFLYIDEMIDGMMRLIESDYTQPLNIGSDYAISINDLVEMVCEISGKQHLFIKHIDGPQGVRGRNSDNELCESVLGWKPSASLRSGMEKLYSWIEGQVEKDNEKE